MAAMRFGLVAGTGVATAASPVLLGSGTHSNVIVDLWGAPGKELLERCSSRSATCFPAYAILLYRPFIAGIGLQQTSFNRSGAAQPP